MDFDAGSLPRVNEGRSQRFAKRSLDLVLGFVALVVLSPFLIASAIAVKLGSRGPVLFKQERIGLNGEPFTMVKFRTMVAEADDEIHRQYTRELIEGRAQPRKNEEGQDVFLLDDPRITGVGKLLRRLSLDELPNLLNVLKGDMSLVGPRPPLWYEVEHYDARSKQRFLVKPGMTGLAQVNGRGSLKFEQIIEYDLEYVRNQSLWLDLTIIARTIPTVLFRRGV